MHYLFFFFADFFFFFLAAMSYHLHSELDFRAHVN
jgi:hypothetical protein